MAEKRRVSAAKAGQGWALQKPNPGGLRGGQSLYGVVAHMCSLL